MALVSLSFYVCVMIVCWPQLSSSVNDCPCPEIPKWNLTKLPQQRCFKINNHFRYTCKDGYLRKAGTSNLIRCKDAGVGAYWSELKPALECIPDPRITTTQTPKATTVAITTTTTTTTTTESHTDISISTSAHTTASTTQMMQNASTALEQGTTTQTTTHAEPMIETTGKTKTNATASPRRNAKTDATTTTAATVTTVLLAIVCTAGIVLLCRRLKRRQREHTSEYQEAEMHSLNA